jgi:NAD+ kinase
MSMCRQVTVLTHQRPGQTGEAMRRLVDDARRDGVELRFDVEEAAKHAVRPESGVIVTGASVGFLATVDPGELPDGFSHAFRGEFDRLELPAIEIEIDDRRYLAFNDISLHRRMGDRVAELSYSLDGEEVGSVRCDGIVVCTPAGSTGYNLANGGPVMAWGVEGFGVSFIAPHSLAARSLVVAPDDGLRIQSRSEHGVDISVDGRPAGALEPGTELRARFARDSAVLAQQPGTSFYRRLREKFGRLSR